MKYQFLERKRTQVHKPVYGSSVVIDTSRAQYHTALGREGLGRNPGAGDLWLGSVHAFLCGWQLGQARKVLWDR